MADRGEKLRDGQPTHALTETGRSSPKIEPLRGGLQPERKRCGRPSCRCARGLLHGPSWRLYWYDGGKRRRASVRPADVERVRAGLDAWRRAHPPARSMRDVIRDLRRLLRRPDLEGV